jgi:alpha-amylase/alpha-mannosidase (GH57 family)
MSKINIKIALLWHMHQPFYRDPFNNKITLPWVRLHALKDYYGMVAILKDFPRVKATYNLVPSLLTQLGNYTRGEKDIFQDVFLKDAQSLETEEIHFLIRHFFSANPRNHIDPWPRYKDLYDKKNRFYRGGQPDPPWEKIFTVDELRDLQVWFQLTHFDEEYRQNDERVKGLMQKGHHFSETDKKEVEAVEMELLGKIIPTYQTYLDSGQIEISTTPFYHPILPLLIDPQAGRLANPDLPEYDLHFNWQDDALYQLESALSYMENTFGKRPAGIWPSEGSLSEKVLFMLDDLGIRWTAADETNLSRSLGIPIERDHEFMVKNPEILYKPYVLKDNRVRIFFRDRYLSDLLSFHYQDIPHDAAVNDLLKRIKNIKPSSPPKGIVVPIILDGENAWEYYPNSGRDFLREFFQRVSQDETLEAVTFSEILDSKPGIKSGKLTHFSAGSWINGNFDIWIGDEEDRRGWKLLERTKKALEQSKAGLSPAREQETREYIAIAQGSDWFWWFGREHYTPDLDIFDDLFRKNLRKVYHVVGKETPPEFSLPVFSPFSRERGLVVIPPVRSIHPRIDGRIGSYLEWLHGGCIDTAASGGAMNRANPLVKTLYYGFDNDIRSFYLRVDTRTRAAEYFENGYSLDIIIKKDNTPERFPVDPVDPVNPTHAGLNIETAIDRIIEMRIPLESIINLGPGKNFYLQLEWKYRGDYFQTIPFNEYFSLAVPAEKDYARLWFV